MAGAAAESVVTMKVLLEMCFVALIISSGPSSTEAVTTITQAMAVAPEISPVTSTTNKTVVDNSDSNFLLSSNITETKDTTTRTATSHGQEKESAIDDTAVNAILHNPDSSSSVNNPDTHHKSNDKMHENNSIAPANVDKLPSPDHTENGENTAPMNKGPSISDTLSGRPDQQFVINALPSEAEPLALQNTPSTTVHQSPSTTDMTTATPTEDVKHTSMHELDAYNLTRALSTVATALGEDAPTAASTSAMPSGLIFIIILVVLVLVEVGVVNLVNWWKERDISWNGERRYFSYLILLLNRKSTSTADAGPIDDATPIVQEA